MFQMIRNSQRRDSPLFCVILVTWVICWFIFVDCLKDNVNVDLNNSNYFLSENYTAICNVNIYNYNQTCCENNQFQCRSRACIPLDKVCNSNSTSYIFTDSEYFLIDTDCVDGSDEIGCSLETCATRRPTCPHKCIDLPNNKSQCSCYKGYQLQTTLNNISCVDVDECAIGVHSCSHDCINLNGTFECSCRKGFRKYSNESKNNCYVKDKMSLVLFYERDWIYSFNLTSGNTRSVKVVHSGKVKYMDYDPATEILYWTNATSVTRSYIPGAKNGTVTIGYPQEIKVPESLDNTLTDSLAIDWIAGNLYWLSPDTLNESVSQIMVSKLDGRYVKTIIKIPKATSFILDPEYGRMYWASAGDDPHIGSAWMNGMLRSTLVRLPKQNPIALTLDHLSNGRLYWVDSLRHTIYSIFKVGPGTRQVYTTTPEQSPISLDVFENNLYWVTKESKELLTINKFGKGEVKHLYRFSDYNSSIKVYHKRKIEKDNREGGAFCGSQCSHLCLHIPGGYFCNCPDGYKVVSVGDEMICDNEQEKPLEYPLDCNCLDKELVCNTSSPYRRCPCNAHCPDGLGEYDHESGLYISTNNFKFAIISLTVTLGCIVGVVVIVAMTISFYKKNNVHIISAPAQTRSSEL